jgi:hypothetical protein
MLTAGTWQLRVDARRYKADRVLTIAPGQGPIEIVLQKGRADVPYDQQLRGQGKPVLGLLGYVAVAFYSMIGLSLGGGNIGNKAHERNNKLLDEAGVDPKMTPYDPAVLTQLDAAFPTREYHRRLKLSEDLVFSGTTVAMSGVGVTLALLPMLLRRHKRAMWIPFGVGLAAVAGGAVWTAHWASRHEALLEPTTAEHRVYDSQLNRLTGHQLGGSMLLGAGLGMIAVAPIYWIGQAVKRRKQARATADAAPLMAPGALGLTLRGRF